MSKLDRINSLLDSGAIATPMPKTLTVPQGQVFHITGATSIYTSSADVGNRLLALEILAPGAVLVSRHVSGAVFAASLTRFVFWGPGAHEAAFDVDALAAKMPQLILPALWQIRLVDDTDVSAANDAARLLVSGLMQGVG